MVLVDPLPFTRKGKIQVIKSWKNNIFGEEFSHGFDSNTKSESSTNVDAF